MTVGSWDPSKNTNDNLSVKEGVTTIVDTVDTLRSAAAKGLSTMDAAEETLEQLSSSLTQQEAALKALTTATTEEWVNALVEFSDQELEGLIRFFALVEEQLSDWQLGASSPAIAVNKVLKQRGSKLSVATLKWLRRYSTNRYIPNGPLPF